MKSRKERMPERTRLYVRACVILEVFGKQEERKQIGGEEEPSPPERSKRERPHLRTRGLRSPRRRANHKPR
jgi:hypothetical protein